MDSKLISKILVPVDFSEVTNAVIKTVKFIGEKYQPKVYLLHVISPMVYISAPESMVVDVIDVQVVEEIEETKKRNAENLITNLKEELKPLDVEGIIEIGSPADVIVEEEEKLNVDLTILGGHEKGLVERIMLGSTSEAVVKHIKKPVWVIKGKPVNKFERIAVAYDFSEDSDKMLDYLKEFLKPFGKVKITLIHVEEEIDLPILEKLGIKLVEQIRERKQKLLSQIKENFEKEGFPLEVAYIEEREPVEGILEVLEKGDYDTIFIASKGISGLKRIMMGSTSLEVLRKAHIPVFVYKIH